MKTVYLFFLLPILFLYGQIEAQEQNLQQKPSTLPPQQIEYEKKLNAWRTTISEAIQDNISEKKSSFSNIKNSSFLNDVRNGKKPNQQSINYITTYAAEVLATSDYTSEDAQYLLKNYSVNLIDAALGYRKNASSSILFSDIVIVGKVDSIYMDHTLQDGHFLSYRFIVKEVIKGAIRSTFVIVRDNEYYLKYNSYNNKYELASTSADFDPPFYQGQEYMLYLSKVAYEEQLQRILATTCNKVIDGKLYTYTQNITPEIQALRANCYGTIYCLPLTHGDSWLSPSRIQSEIATTRLLSKELTPFFSKKSQQKQ
jgi:hypothetical protein